MRPELVPGLDHISEGAVLAGPTGKSCARESVYPPGFTQYSSGNLQSLTDGPGSDVLQHD